MSHVLEELELYALGALPAAERGAVARHLAECESCRSAASELEEVVSRLPEAVPPREPPAALRERILRAAAATDGEAPRRGRWRGLPRLDLRLVALSAAVLVLVAADVGAGIALRSAQAERDRYAAALESLSHGGRWWYMAGVDEWTGSGGNLVAPGNSRPAFVIFHDLRDLPPGQTYTLWLITPDGGWSRGTSFRPADGMDVVAVGLDIEGFDRCAVTVETTDSGKRQGPIVMQSRIAPPSR